MSRWNKGLVAAMGWGLGVCLCVQVAQAGEKSGKAGTKTTEVRPAVPQLNVKIRPPQVTVVPPSPAREPMLLPVAIEEEATSVRPTKIVPVRAYARDGASFYQNGQLILVQGLADAGGEHAKQRLQQLLDGGQVSVLPVGGASGDGMLAVVRVNGRDVAEAMASD